jgi:hypothetical protein
VYDRSAAGDIERDHRQRRRRRLYQGPWHTFSFGKKDRNISTLPSRQCISRAAAPLHTFDA